MKDVWCTYFVYKCWYTLYKCINKVFFSRGNLLRPYVCVKERVDMCENKEIVSDVAMIRLHNMRVIGNTYVMADL